MPQKSNNPFLPSTGLSAVTIGYARASTKCPEYNTTYFWPDKHHSEQNTIDPRVNTKHLDASISVYDRNTKSSEVSTDHPNTTANSHNHKMFTY